MKSRPIITGSTDSTVDDIVTSRSESGNIDTSIVISLQENCHISTEVCSDGRKTVGIEQLYLRKWP
ncbi:hypothetical protein MTR_6g049030 [Medicago truncatula]|uniref:Uncharacterized protein n=1 Tax=Medicago truncatula TaxID=3880 RepID=A0A072U8Z4_MEDTR|nr:hypothetical protein MTR_6g049030 [Medicago truncatula]